MWALNRIRIKKCAQANPESNKNSGTYQQHNTTTASNRKKACIVVPFTKGLGKTFKKVCSKHGIQEFFRGRKNIKPSLQLHRSKITSLQRVG